MSANEDESDKTDLERAETTLWWPECKETEFYDIESSIHGSENKTSTHSFQDREKTYTFTDNYSVSEITVAQKRYYPSFIGEVTELLTFEWQICVPMFPTETAPQAAPQPQSLLRLAADMSCQSVMTKQRTLTASHSDVHRQPWGCDSPRIPGRRCSLWTVEDYVRTYLSLEKEAGRRVASYCFEGPLFLKGH